MSRYIIDLPDNLVNLTGVYWKDDTKLLAKPYSLSDLVPYVESDRDVAEDHGEWKKEKEKIDVGDEVWIMEEAQNGVVTSTTDSGFLTIIDEDGDSRLRYDYDVVKTNRHYPEVEKLLKQMRR